jgi:hypothetical protein
MAARGVRPVQKEAAGRKGGKATNLFAQPLNVHLGKLFAGHQTLDPTVEGRDGGWLEVGRRQPLGSAPDVLHVGIHSENAKDSDVAARAGVSRWSSEMVVGGEASREQ